MHYKSRPDTKGRLDILPLRPARPQELFIEGPLEPRLNVDIAARHRFILRPILPSYPSNLRIIVMAKNYVGRRSASNFMMQYSNRLKLY